MDFIFSLAHYCEIHGPTSVICTQALSEPCSSRSPVQEASGPTSDHDTLFRASLDSPLDRPADLLLKASAPLPPSATSEPGPAGSKASQLRPRNGFAGAAETDQDESCASCSFDIPDDVSKKLPNGAPGSPSSKTGSKRYGSPVLRTRGSIMAECEYAPDEELADDLAVDSSAITSSSLPSSTPASLLLAGSSDASLRSSGGKVRKMSISSRICAPRRHAHSLTYLTTRHPTEPTLYTALRHSCIRTLSVENLPRGTPSGPMLFGDSHSGHTIAFIFRLPDPYARGRRRTYALLAMNPSQDASEVGRAMGRVTAMFRQIASWIVSLAEHASERSSIGITPDPDLNSGDQQSRASVRQPASAAAPPAQQESSFLSARRAGIGGDGPPRRRIYGNIDPFHGNRGFPTRGRGDADGAGGAKGLAELVGREGLFVELHVAFVKALMMLGRDFGAA